MIKTFCQWRAKRCAIYAIKSMNVMDYRGAMEWLRLAKTWEYRAAQR